MFREFTFTDVDRLTALNNADASAGFVMDENTFRAFYDRTARGVWVYLSRVTGDRQMGDTLALIHIADLNPNQATAFQGIEVPSHCGAVERDLGGEATNRQRPEAGKRDQDRQLRDA